MKTPSHQPANQNIYQLIITEYLDHGLQVISIQSNRYALDYNNDFSQDYDQNYSQDYAYQITCYNPQQILLKHLIGKKACLIITNQQGKTYYQHGIITKTNSSNLLHIADTITLHSFLFPLTCNIQQLVYHHVTLQQLITQVLQNSGWEPHEYQFHFRDEYPLCEYVVQYQESDFFFLQRKCAYYGIFFTFIQTERDAILVFCDDINLLTNYIEYPTLSYCSVQGLATESPKIFNIQWQQYMLPDNIRLHDYNDQTPELSLLLESNSKSNHIPLITEFRFQDHYKTLEEGQFLLRIRQQALDCRRKIWQIKSDFPGLQPGQKIQINNHPLTEMNGDFFVISINHYGDQSAAFPLIQHNHKNHNYECERYYNIALLIPASLNYRPTAPEPLYQVNINALITGEPGTYPDIDEQGKYTIQPLFDRNTYPLVEPTSAPVPLVHPLIGDHYGMHFPLHIGTEVFIMHINGDPDRPVIMGVLPNMNGLSSVTAVNKSQHILKSRGDNQLLMDDQIGFEKIVLQTPVQQNQLLLDASAGQEKILLRSYTGDIQLQSGSNITHHTATDFQQVVGQNHMINVKNQQQITAEQGDITLNAGNDIILNAKQNISIKTQDEDIVIRAGNDLMLQSQNSANFMVKQGNMNIHVNNGNLIITSAQGIALENNSESGHIYIAQSGASIQLAGSDITLSSPIAINFNAMQINAGNVIIQNYTDNNAKLVDNLILRYVDEINAAIENLSGIYHLVKYY